MFSLWSSQYNVEPASQRKVDSHHDLEAIEASSFSSLDFTGESFNEIFVDDTVRGGKEGEDVRDEVAFIVVELVLPIMDIL